MLATPPGLRGADGNFFTFCKAHRLARLCALNVESPAREHSDCKDDPGARASNALFGLPIHRSINPM